MIPRIEWPVLRRDLSRVEAARYLGISPSKFDELRHGDRIGPAKILDGRCLDEFLDALPLDLGSTAQMEELLDQKSAAKLLRLSVRTLERHRIAGTGPRFCRLGRLIRYRKSDLREWIECSLQTSTSDGRQ